METRKKYLLKNTILFSIGNFGSKIITFLLVPLYTNVLSTNEYGTVDLMTVLTTVLVPIITLNISEAVMRFSLDKDSNKNDILNIAIFICVISTILSLILIPLFKCFDITCNYSIILSLYISSFSISTILICYLRGIEKLFDYSIISIVQTLIIASLNVLFLVKLGMGIKGYILAYTIAYAFTILLCIIRADLFKTITKISINKKLFKKMALYSIILIPNSLMWWIMNSLDRVMVTSMINIEANGIYAISYKIPTILITLTTIFNQAWMLSAIKEKDSTDKSEYTNSVYHFLSTFIIITAAFLLVILKPLLSVYVGKDFFESWKYVPPLLVGTVFITMGTFLSNEYTAHKDSMGFLKSSTIGAVINIILNFILIKYLGVLGAAIATCISYIVVHMFRVFDTKKYVKIKYIEKKYIINILLLLLISLTEYIKGLTCYLVMAVLFIVLIINNAKTINNILFTIKKKILLKRTRN